MAELGPPSDLPDIPQATAEPKSKSPLQLVWLIPLVAIVIGGWLAVKAIMERGPKITISFVNAEGIEAGKTKISFKDVEIGQVTAVKLTPDLKRVIVTADVVKDFAPHLVDDTRFWLVRTRISGGTVSGLGTLLSGAYLAVNVGNSTVKRREFTALEVPPVVDIGTSGREFVLHSKTAGTLSVGAPVFYRQLQAGEVISYQLDPSGQGVTIKIFITQDYLKYVSANTRFWNESGIGVKLDASGIKLNTGSLVSILIGGIAFETPDTGTPDTRTSASDEPPAKEFVLFSDRDQAMKNPETRVLQFVAVFDQSVRGLDKGAPVDFRGFDIGEVVSINTDIDARAEKVFIPVTLNIYPDRLRTRARKQTAALTPAERKEFIDRMVANGLRAQLRTGNLLTGQRYVALDFDPHALKAGINWSSSPPELPTSGGSLEELQTAIASIAAKIDKMPLQQIGSDVQQTLRSANKLVQRLDSEVTPEARGMLVDARKTLANADRLLANDAPLQQDAQGALREIADAARALRVLADYLERHPESLIRGKPEDKQ
jgi:paraquat-inducible protein B